MRVIAFIFLLGFSGSVVWPQDAAAPVKPVVKEVGNGIWEVGRVRINKSERLAEFPAVVNMDNGIAEYLLVHVNGKLHESVLRTDVDPYQIHVAMLLLGAKGLGTNSFPERPQARIPGDPVTLEVVWNEGSKEKRLPAEDLIYDVKKRAAMQRGSWVYNGSFQSEGVFAAQQTGSIVSAITDPEALINNPRARHDDDENWVVNSKKVPKVERLVTLRIRLERAARN